MKNKITIRADVGDIIKDIEEFEELYSFKRDEIEAINEVVKNILVKKVRYPPKKS